MEKEKKEKLILGIQGAIGAAYLALALKNSVKKQPPQMKKTLAKQAKRLDKLNRFEYKQEKKRIKQQGKRLEKEEKGVKKKLRLRNGYDRIA